MKPILSLAALAACSIAAAKQPNIIYIMADDLGYGEVGCYGQTKIQTPNIDRIAREGIRFTQHYSGAPVCAPARATFLTGRHLGHSQVRDNWERGGYVQGEHALEGQWPLAAGTTTVGTMLQDAGYETGCVGKWGLGGDTTTGEPNSQGFDFFLGYLCQRQAHGYYPTHLWRNREKLSLRNTYVLPHQQHDGDPNDPASFDKYNGKVFSQDVMADQAVQFIRKNKNNPFFLYAAFPVPHVSLQVPLDSLMPYLGKWKETPYLGNRGYLPHPYPRAAYAAMITRMDDNIGQLMDTLEELGLEDDTLIIFTSDNGPTHDVGGVETEFFNSSGGLRGRKGSVWEGGLRVPFVAKWPGKIPANSMSNLPSAFWDMMPTFAEAAGVKSPETDGVSILEALKGKSFNPDRHLLWEFPGYGGQQMVRKGPWKAIRRDVKKNPKSPVMLFNIDEDPTESNDVAAEHPDLVKELRAIMYSDRSPALFESWEKWVQAGK